MLSVNDLYLLSTSKNTPLLSNYSSDFWKDYVNNYNEYDALFRRMFYSFIYFMQFDDNPDTVLSNFIDDVKRHLMVNDKKYSELYRVNVISDENYSITDNYKITENMDRVTTDSDTMNYGAKDEVTTLEKGSKSESTNNTLGQQTNNITNDIAGFNSATYSNDNKTIENLGDRSDTSQTTFSEYTDTSTTNFGKHDDRKSSNGTDKYTLTRIGNIGVKTQTEIMKEHKEFWSVYEFYTFIFKEICAELLLI